ncbi:MAG TPA: glycosyltransferase family 4 protein [Bryobacteraceae bacterium]|nr:glycosyltransferase family 4 protein [Bryobacteraceae bacterium]
MIGSDPEHFNFSPRDHPEALRVALITGTLSRAGAEKQFMYIVRALTDAGVMVRVYCPAHSGYYRQELLDMNIPVYWFGRGQGRLRRLATLIGMLRRFQPHVIQSMHAFTNLYAALSARFVGAVSIGGLRSDLNACLQKYGLMARALLRAPTAIAANSSKAVREIAERKLLDPSRVYLLRNSIDSSETRMQTDIDTSPFTAVFVGRLIPSKRLDLFLNALAMANRIDSRFNGVVIGEGPCLASMRKLATRLGIWPECISFLGVREDVPGILERSGMLVFCSESEGCPNVLLEAMSAGVPVITTAVGDAPEIVEDTKTGYVVPPDDVSALAMRMLQVGQSPGLRQELGEAGRQRVRRLYGLHDLSDRLLTIYEEVMRARSGNPVERPHLTCAER